MLKLNIIPRDDSRFTPEFFQFRKVLSAATSMERTPNHDPAEARLVMDDLARAWLKYRNSPQG